MSYIPSGAETIRLRPRPPKHTWRNCGTRRHVTTNHLLPAVDGAGRVGEDVLACFPFKAIEPGKVLQARRLPETVTCVTPRRLVSRNPAVVIGTGRRLDGDDQQPATCDVAVAVTHHEEVQREGGAVGIEPGVLTECGCRTILSANHALPFWA